MQLLLSCSLSLSLSFLTVNITLFNGKIILKNSRTPTASTVNVPWNANSLSSASILCLLVFKVSWRQQGGWLRMPLRIPTQSKSHQIWIFSCHVIFTNRMTQKESKNRWNQIRGKPKKNIILSWQKKKKREDKEKAKFEYQSEDKFRLHGSQLHFVQGIWFFFSSSYFEWMKWNDLHVSWIIDCKSRKRCSLSLSISLTLSLYSCM